MPKLLETVRKATLPALWSQGVKLARDRAVSRVAQTPTELTLRVRAPGHAIAPTVTLWLEEDEWSCDCGGKVDPCAHVAAATIAFSQGDLDASPTEEAPKPARLAYRFGSKNRRFVLSRVIVDADGKESALGASLSSVIAKGSALSPTHEDLLVDRILGTPAREMVPLARIGDIFEALSAGADVTFQGSAIKLSSAPVLPQAVVSDTPQGFVLRLDKDRDVDEVVAMGVVRAKGFLRPVGEVDTQGEFLEKLPLSRKFTFAEESDLVTKVIPQLEKKIPVVIATKRALIRAKKDARPRIAMDFSHHGHTLSVLPTLVYGNPPIARIDGETVVSLGREVPVRRRDEERVVLARLRDGLNLVPGRRVDFDGSDAARFASKLRAWQVKEGDDRDPLSLDGPPLSVRVDFSDDAFDVVFESAEEVDGEKRRADPLAVLRAYRDGLELVPLDGGGWARLPSDWLSKYGHRVADLLAARDAEKKVPKALVFDLSALAEALDAPRPLGVDKLAPLLENFDGIPRATLPKGVRATLRSYQHAGVDWLSFLRDAELGAVLADDMGLGKTVQTICALRGRTLVVCPRSVVYNWMDEIARFRPNLRAAIYHGVNRSLDRTADVTLTTYAVLRLDVEALAREDWDIVVLDEAQAIKNASSQTARAAFEIGAKFRVALSGTPVENRLEELWSIMHFANPGLLGGLSDFQMRYANALESGDATAGPRLRDKIRPFVLRRLKRDVLPELPPRTEQVLHVELDDDERSVYDAVRVATKKSVADALASGGGGVLAALEALLRLRQASCHSSLVPGQSAQSSSKLERLLEALDEAVSDGHKALVFSQWTSLLDLVEPHLTEAGIRFTRLDGSTRDRASVVAEFQDAGGPPVMLVSLKAGGTGLNLTAADHVFLLDPWWNPTVEDQAADRAHRIGQDRPVIVYRMVAKDTVEERILALQEKKRAIADVALGEADRAASITRDELLALLD